MVDGPQPKKVAFIIQARMQSTRLPGKILQPLPLWGDKPMLLWIVEALKASKFDGKIFIATSKNNENDVLENFCELHGINCFRGDEENVLSRFIQILKETNYETVVRLTADNPILDTVLLDATIAYHLQQDNDYTNTQSLPLGMNFEVIRSEALAGIGSLALGKSDKEHVTLFLRNSDSYKKSCFDPGVATGLMALRLTVDYASDLLVVSSLLAFSSLYEDLKGISLVKKVFEKYPALFEANMVNVQKKQFESEAFEIEYAKKLLTSLELDQTVAILKRYEEENSI